MDDIAAVPLTQTACVDGVRPVVLLFALVALACSHEKSMPHLPNPNAPLEIVTGEQLTVALDANPTTGFAWQLATPPDEKVVALVGHEFQRAASARVGAGGTDVWTFKAVGAGSTTIVLEYRRPWEKDAPAAERKRFVVVVR